MIAAKLIVQIYEKEMKIYHFVYITIFINQVSCMSLCYNFVIHNP